MDQYQLPNRDEEIEKQQKESLRLQVQAGFALDPMIRSEGWKYVLSYIQAQIKAFTSDAINNGFDTFDEFKVARAKINALQGMIQFIEESIGVAQKEHEKQSTATPSDQ